MNYFLLILVTLGVSIQQICKKAYNKKTGGGAFTFSAATSLIALLFFIGTSKGEFNFQPELLWYSISFAICFFSPLFSILTNITEISNSTIPTKRNALADSPKKSNP